MERAGSQVAGPGNRASSTSAARVLPQPVRAEQLAPQLRPEPSDGAAAHVFGKISAKCCSFSAVSAPIFARKYAFCSICQNLPDSQAENFEIS